jgi:hypothetical protein
MKSESSRTHQLFCKAPAWYMAIAFLLLVGIAPRVDAQTFSSGSDGSDGTFFAGGPPGTVVVFDPSQYRGTQTAANIFNFTTITVQAGVTVKLSSLQINGPVYWLAQGDVDIEGTIDLSGSVGHTQRVDPFSRIPSIPGPGGYAGGVGGNYSTQQGAFPGNGPGGGAAGPVGGYAPNGRFSGNQFLMPLVGGSGGGGGQLNSGNTGSTAFGAGGGAGGGALLIASSTRIVVNGTINANGGAQGYFQGGGGSGGAIRLVSNTISGTGKLTAIGVDNQVGTSPPGGPGVVRTEANNLSFSGVVSGTRAQSSPFPLLLPTAGPATAKVISIGGVIINANPATFPDITINTTTAVPVVIQTHNIPVAATIQLTILDQNGVADTVIPAPPLGNCDQDNICTTTVNVVFPFGASRGLTKVTWTQ